MYVKRGSYGDCQTSHRSMSIDRETVMKITGLSQSELEQMSDKLTVDTLSA
ncbi:hypothetical protein [Photorhabdus khanii]|uniref:hypothetical protein n=1 Tax=Photorhabdus khanii TaxID=1004150 RepID=UPI001864CDBE|nr:hypothetical protein [Photorhabdus khanii]